MSNLRANELLGHPGRPPAHHQRRRLRGVPRGQRSHPPRLTDGVARSTTLMVPCPWALHAMRLLGDHPDIAFGVHLTVISEFADYRWGPLASRNEVPSLLDETGFFYSNDRQAELLARAELDELEAEFRAQIEAVLAAGLGPAAPRLALPARRWSARRLRPDVRAGQGVRPGAARLRPDQERTAAAVGPAHRRPRSGGQHAAGDGGQNGPVCSHAAGIAARAERVGGPPRPRHRRGAGHRRLVAKRVADLRFLVSREARETVAEEGIVLLDYRALQAIWNRDRARHQV